MVLVVRAIVVTDAAGNGNGNENANRAAREVSRLVTRTSTDTDLPSGSRVVLQAKNCKAQEGLP